MPRTKELTRTTARMLAAAPDGQEFSDAERKEVMKGDGLFADPLVKASGPQLCAIFRQLTDPGTP
jgi:hypothetical protein